MGSATPSPPIRSPAATTPEDSALLPYTQSSVLRACDIVLGTTSMALAVLGVALLVVGQAEPLTVVALWLIPILNIAWSAWSRHRDRLISDLLRGLVCLPIAAYLYVAERGVFEKLWIPALVMSVGIALSVGIASRRSLPGYVVTLAYAAALFAAACVQIGDWDIAAIYDVLGIALTGCLISLVASKLGRTLDEARRQRDVAHEQKDRAEAVLLQLTQRSHELTTAIASLHDEMEHRARVEIELRQAQKLESIGRLAAGVAHEINTPVQFVNDSIQFVRDGIGELFGVVDKLGAVQRAVLDGMPSRAAADVAADATDTADLPYLVANVPRALDRALEGLDRVATIVRSMKEFAHPDAKEMQLADLNRAIENTLTIARNEYRGVAELEVELGEIPLVRCHIGELNQAVLNIVTNAAHAIEDVVHGSSAKGRIRIQTYRDGDEVVIALADTGTGIPEGARAHIFDPFFTTKEVGRGSGQGLAIAHSVVVDKHHGRLEFQTELGKGTTFFIRLAIDGQDPAIRASAA
jgi:signal transduction histidine kinase